MAPIDLKLQTYLPITTTTGRTAEAGDATVPSKINSLQSSLAAVTAASPVGKVGQGGGAPQQGDGTGAADVHITGTARNLVALEQQIRDLPAVNETRVATVSQRIADGSYQIDPQRIASKLLGLEHDLSSGGSAA